MVVIDLVDYYQTNSLILVHNIKTLNEMIDSNTWNKIKVNINDLEHICRENNIPLCFAYYRLAYEGIISYGSKEYNEHKEKIN